MGFYRQNLSSSEPFPWIPLAGNFFLLASYSVSLWKALHRISRHLYVVCAINGHKLFLLTPKHISGVRSFPCSQPWTLLLFDYQPIFLGQLIMRPTFLTFLPSMPVFKSITQQLSLTFDLPVNLTFKLCHISYTLYKLTCWSCPVEHNCSTEVLD